MLKEIKFYKDDGAAQPVLRYRDREAGVFVTAA